MSESDKRWAVVAARVADALAVQPGDVVEVRERCGRYDVLQEMLLAIEQRGGVPLPQILPPAYYQRLLAGTDPALLALWDRRRLSWVERDLDRVLVLAGEERRGDVPIAARDAWRQAVDRLTDAEERRRLPYLLMAIPTEARAQQCGTTLAALEDIVLPALSATPQELGREIDRVMGRLRAARTLTIRSAAGELHLTLAARSWLSDAGTLPSTGISPDGVQPVNNLPAGAIYTTVLEEATHGSIRVLRAAKARDVTLHFAGGRVVAIDAAEGKADLEAIFARHSGEARRVSHVGIGLNPHLRREVGWTLVDEHRHGNLLLAMGENRYLGGVNQSSLNVDFALPTATLLADSQAIVVDGTLVV